MQVFFFLPRGYARKKGWEPLLLTIFFTLEKQKWKPQVEPIRGPRRPQAAIQIPDTRCQFQPRFMNTFCVSRFLLILLVHTLERPV